MGNESMAERRLRRAAKRSIDIGVSGFALLVLSPLVAVVAIAIRVSMGPPVLFRQARAGRDGRPFEMVKFRTMTTVPVPGGSWDADTSITTRLASDVRRTTPVGAVLRRTSLDEIPQLWNILRGDMSLVGPRPLLVEYLPHYTLEEARRHEIRPGLTGWAQVHGRTNVPMHERFLMDVWYIDNWSLRLDLEILLATARRAATTGTEGSSCATDPFFDRLRREPGHAACPRDPAASLPASGGDSS